MREYSYIWTTNNKLKGTVSQDFYLLCFVIFPAHLEPLFMCYSSFEFIVRFAEMLACAKKPCSSIIDTTESHSALSTKLSKFQIFIFKISAKSKTASKILKHVNQVP